jgi:putative FmdB family regulatory protein
MPTYEYSCPGCGEFELWRPAAHSGEPVACPACGASAPRRYAPPNVRLTAAPLGAAIERSAYEPKVVTSPPRDGVPLHGTRRPPQASVAARLGQPENEGGHARAADSAL